VVPLLQEVRRPQERRAALKVRWGAPTPGTKAVPRRLRVLRAQEPHTEAPQAQSPTPRASHKAA
jgi:hypothetical protein